EHRLMHLETLAYMFHNFGYEWKRGDREARLEQTGRAAPENSFVEIPQGVAVLGKPRDDVFGWDNEYEETRVEVPAFRVQKYSVSNGDYLRFVRSGAHIPHFWTKRGEAFFYRGMFEEIPLPLDWPVYVTKTEAASYAQWMGKSLFSEEQFQRAAYGEGREYPWGDAAPAARHGNFDF